MAGRNNPHFAPCGAWARSAQRPCIRKPTLDKDGRPVNGRCASHGGKSTGPKTPEGLARSQKANWKHGRHSADARSNRREFALILAEMLATIDQVEEIV